MNTFEEKMNKAYLRDLKIKHNVRLPEKVSLVQRALPKFSSVYSLLVPCRFPVDVPRVAVLYLLEDYPKSPKVILWKSQFQSRNVVRFALPKEYGGKQVILVISKFLILEALKKKIPLYIPLRGSNSFFTEDYTYIWNDPQDLRITLNKETHGLIQK